MKKISSTKITKEINTFELIKDIFTYRELRENGKIKEESIISKLKKPTWEKDSFYPHVIYCKDLKALKTDVHYTEIFKVNEEILVFKDLKNYFENNEFKVENFLIFNNSSHMIFDYKYNPISTLYVIDFSFKEKIRDDFTYVEIIKILKKHKYTKELVEQIIPSYNSDFYYQKGISNWKVQLPQDLYLKIWNEILKTPEKNGHPSCTLKDYISNLHIFSKYDIYGINKLAKKLSETEQIYEDNDDNY